MVVSLFLDPILIAGYVCVWLWRINQCAHVRHLIDVGIQVCDFVCYGGHSWIETP